MVISIISITHFTSIFAVTLYFDHQIIVDNDLISNNHQSLFFNPNPKPKKLKDLFSKLIKHKPHPDFIGQLNYAVTRQEKFRIYK